MKQTIFTLLLLSVVSLISCRKDKFEPNIQQFDLTQIQSYISSNHITGMVKDTSGGDTTGIYYKIITHGTGSLIGDTSNISFVFSLRTFDGKYTSPDTVSNHYQGYAGHILSDALPYGLELAIINDLKYRGGSMRLLIPSRLAYGVSGYGSGSSSVANARIAGNQCLDYYVHVINNISPNSVSPAPDNQATYDNLVIQNYMNANSLTGYTRDPDGLWYKIAVPGTRNKLIDSNSTVTVTFEGRLLNGTVFDGANNPIADTVALEMPNLLRGQQEALSHATSGATVSMIFPSALGYGQTPVSGVPVNSCLRYEMEVRRVFP